MPLIDLPLNCPEVILPFVVAWVASVCLIAKPAAVDTLPGAHVIVRVPLVGALLALGCTSVWQLAGVEADVWVNLVVPLVTPPPTQPLTVPVELSFDLTFVELPS